MTETDFEGNIYGCNDGISSNHAKELPEQLSIHRGHKLISHFNECSTYLRDWYLKK